MNSPKSLQNRRALMQEYGFKDENSVLPWQVINTCKERGELFAARRGSPRP